VHFLGSGPQQYCGQLSRGLMAVLQLDRHQPLGFPPPLGKGMACPLYSKLPSKGSMISG